eukprot:TRINITY_DN13274_c0_g1_i2.p1 TRINITY_DN13274_c0_g1~~TRINITY_DN13274_c0_g1_i2.p1  ORF type:complete len:182 (-),score=36.68 TRINITY_DN13274_c0_g1_i2:116-637(-)
MCDGEQRKTGSEKYYDRLLQGTGFCSKPVKSKFGANILKKMGWTEGKGLGKHEDGEAECFQVKRRADNAGVGSSPAGPAAPSWNTAFWETMYNDAAKKLTVIVNPDVDTESIDSQSVSEKSTKSAPLSKEVAAKNSNPTVVKKKKTIRKHKCASKSEQINGQNNSFYLSLIHI